MRFLNGESSEKTFDFPKSSPLVLRILPTYLFHRHQLKAAIKMPASQTTNKRAGAKGKSQSQLNMRVSKATPKLASPKPAPRLGKRQLDDAPNPHAKKQRITSPESDDEEDESDDDFNASNEVSQTVRKVSVCRCSFQSYERERLIQVIQSHSTLHNDEEEDDELEAFEKENATPSGSTNKPAAKKEKRKSAKSSSQDPSTKDLALDPDERARFDELAVQCRLVFLARFKLVRAAIVRSIWGDLLSSDWRKEEATSRVSWNSSNWKVRAITNMKVETYAHYLLLLMSILTCPRRRSKNSFERTRTTLSRILGIPNH